MHAQYTDEDSDSPEDSVYDPRGFDPYLGKYSATPCYYCGMPACTTDHVVPQSLLETLQMMGDEDMARTLNSRHRIKTVDACRECNSLIGAQYFPTLEERKRWLKGRLRRRYRKALEVPPWRESELAQLSPNLRAYVMQGIHDAAVIRKRLAF